MERTKKREIAKISFRESFFVENKFLFNNFFTNIDTNLVKDIPGAEKNFYESFIHYNVLSNRWVV